MIYAYGVSLAGTYHIKNGVVCQDAHNIIRMSKDVAIAAVADGLGSATHSDIGSKIAAAVSTRYCRQHLTWQAGEAQVLDIIRASYTAALAAIEKTANEKDHSIDLYDTTLTLAVLVGDTLFYGHSGDSGMIALCASGRYEQVTQQQRDPDGRLYPLFFSDRWEFAKYEQKVASVLLATDGMFETFFPIYIKNDEVKIHVSPAQFFMDYRTLRISKLGEETVQNNMREFVDNIPDDQVNDDKTIVVLMNSAIKAKRQPKEYYAEPDWAALKQRHDEEWRRAAYPGLYKDQDAAKPQKPASPTPPPVARRSPGTQPLKARPKPRQPILRMLAMLVIGIFVGSAGMFLGMRQIDENGDGAYRGHANGQYDESGYGLYGVDIADDRGGDDEHPNLLDRGDDEGFAEYPYLAAEYEGRAESQEGEAYMTYEAWQGGYVEIQGERFSTDARVLSLNNRGLTDEDIVPLRYMVNLRYLWLNGNEVTDLQPLSGLVNLETLRLGNNHITDLEPLSALVNMQILVLNGNRITDLQPISNLVNLRHLELNGNSISDLQPISALVNLEQLELNDNYISDLQPLGGLVNMQMLRLNDNQITDLQPLGGLVNMQMLSLNGNSITDLQPISSLVNLEQLELYDNYVGVWWHVAHVPHVVGRPHPGVLVP